MLTCDIPVIRNILVFFTLWVSCMLGRVFGRDYRVNDSCVLSVTCVLMTAVFSVTGVRRSEQHAAGRQEVDRTESKRWCEGRTGRDRTGIYQDKTKLYSTKK